MESTVTIAAQRVEQAAESRRIPAFDFTKGALVLFMVLYHWLNYFYGPQGAIYNYLRFLTPSFIFITGFLISFVHFAKYGVGSLKLSKRLSWRGIKLLAVFIGLNVLLGFVMPSSFVREIWSGRPVWTDLDSLFLLGDSTGSQSGKSAAFTILVSISYLLVLSALLSIACKFFKYAFHAAFLLSLFCMVLLSSYGMQSLNLEFITVGLLGVVLGFTPRNAIQKIADSPWLIGLAYCTYLAAITVWNVSLYVQMVGAVLTTALLYVIGSSTKESNRLGQHVVLLGQYSLFGYISQIAILQALNISLRHVESGAVILAASLVAGFGLTILSAEAVDRGRKRSRAIDSVYRAIFA